MTTGFSDRILFTERDMNVYYPVLGCDSDDANCTKNGTPAPAYVQFSVPDNVTYNNQDAIGFDWYQPVHEPGNVFTYPWTFEQLQSRFTDSVTTLTKAPSCLSLGSGTSAATTTWSQSSSKSNRSGSTNSFSDELSMSYSEGVGVEGADSADVNWSLDIAAHTSLNTLNESTSAMSSSQGITITESDFGRPALCCNYGFGQYIFGLKNTKNAASQDACQNGQTPEADGCIAIPDPDSTSNPPAQTGIGSTGLLFTGYVASPVNGDCSGNNSAWWKQVYTLPDVGLNHPEQWQWDSGRQSVTFQDANSNSVLVDNGFYAMKGFFVSKKSVGGSDNLTLPSGPSLAVANADDLLTLTIRVYNYSLVDTTAPVHVRFYGQLYCNSAGEASCTNWKTNKLCTNSVGGVNTGDVCGDSFQIGSDQTISSIAGFNDNGASTTPNWQLTSVGFTPTDFTATRKGNLHMVFWVVVWMQDANGNPVAEMPDHGLIAVPDPGLTQITQVATQEHSNNVGMYPVHQFFQILPVGTAPAAALGGGSLKSISLSTSSPIPLGKRTKVVATLRATGARMKSVKIAYYDGDPAKMES